MNNKQLDSSTSLFQGHHHYEKIEAAIEFIQENQLHQPSLKEVSEHIGLSEFHTQRVFSEWAGLSPKQYLQYLTKEKAKQHLRTSPVLESAMASGLSGSARLHDLIINWEAMTPGEYKQLGKDLEIGFGFGISPYGECMIAWTYKGICRLVFMHSELDRGQAILQLKQEWALASFLEDNDVARDYCASIFRVESIEENHQVKLLIKGTPFQLKVWEALIQIPDGELRSYEQIAVSMNSPNSTRAVASAIAKNSIGWLIPCHRVIRKGGELSNYRWGKTRKAAMIARELGCHHQDRN